MLFTDEVKRKAGVNERQVLNAATLNELDDLYTRRLAGFNNLSDFYTAMSCSNHLRNIRVPMVFINARDDPIVPPPLLEIVRDAALNHEQMQFLQSRKYTKSDICGLFRVPAYLIGDLSETTKLGSSIEEQNRVFYELTLLPYINRVETALTMMLPRNQFARIDVSGLLRANIKARYEAYNLGRNAGFLTVNEIRAKEDLAPVDSEIGDSYLQNLNQLAVQDQEDQTD